MKHFSSRARGWRRERGARPGHARTGGGNRAAAPVAVVCAAALLLTTWPLSPVRGQPPAAPNDAGRQLAVEAAPGVFVNTFNGNLQHQLDLVSFPGREPVLELLLTYNSSWNAFATASGFGWQLN